MEISEIDQQILKLPESVKEFLLDQVRLDGGSPGGKSLARTATIYKLIYYTPDKIMQMVVVGQKRRLGVINAEVHAIIYDWLNSRGDTKVFSIMIKKLDGSDAVHIYESISCRECKVTYDI